MGVLLRIASFVAGIALFVAGTALFAYSVKERKKVGLILALVLMGIGSILPFI